MTNERETLTERVAKLMAMAEHPASNPEEAAVAAAKAAKLILEHNLEDWALEKAGKRSRDGYTHQSFAHHFFGSLAPRDLLRTLAHENFCVAIQDFGSKAHNFEIVGKPKNIDAVIYLYNYFVSELSRMERAEWKARKAQGDITQSKHWTAFWIGAVGGIAKALRDARAATRAAGDDSMALIVLTGKELAEATANMFSGLAPVKRHDMETVDAKAYRAGYAAGGSLAAPKRLGEPGA